MVQKPDRGRYLILEDVRVSYNHKKNAINITSSDPDIPNGAFHMILNKGTESEEALRSLLTENDLIKPTDVVPALDTEMKEIHQQNFLSLAQELSSDIRMGKQRNIALVGIPGTGKTFFMDTMIQYSSLLGSTVISIRDGQGSPSFAEISKSNKANFINLTECDGLLNPLNDDVAEGQKSVKFYELLKLFIDGYSYNDEYYRIEALKHIQNAINVISVSSTLKLNIETLLQFLSSSDIPAVIKVRDLIKHVMELPNSNLFFKKGLLLKDKIKEGYINIIDLEAARNYPIGLSLVSEIEISLIKALTEFTEIKTNDELPLVIFVDDLSNPGSDKPLFNLMEQVKSEKILSKDDRRIGDYRRSGNVVAGYWNSIEVVNSSKFSDFVLFRVPMNGDNVLKDLIPALNDNKALEISKNLSGFHTSECIRISPDGKSLTHVARSLK